MKKYFENPGNKKRTLEKGFRFKHLTVISDPYYIHPRGSGKHRRQYFDFQCDCGGTISQMADRVKKGAVLGYCSYDCPIYQDSLPQEPPEENKKCKLGEVYHYLTITKESFYYKFKGEMNRHRAVEVQCKCGKKKIYREDKVFKGKYKSCGCVWEKRSDKDRNWNQLKKYGITQEEYLEMLEKQNYGCAICKSKDTGTNKTNWLFVDHCHTTGKVRSLLCNKCNGGLGQFNDDTELLQRAIEYLVDNFK